MEEGRYSQDVIKSELEENSWKCLRLNQQIHQAAADWNGPYKRAKILNRAMNILLYI